MQAELDALAGGLIEDTQTIISFETVSGGDADQEAKYQDQIPACLEWLRQKAEANGLEFRCWDNRVAEIQWKAEAPRTAEIQSVGVASHIDVVTPVGSWKYGPFNAQVGEDGMLYGRGIQDDKGPLIQTLYGILAAKRAGVKLPCDVRIIIGTSEETGDWSDIAHYVEQRGAPDCSFTPDADFPIIIGEKGMVNAVYSAKWPAAGADETTGMQFVSLRGGDRENIVPSLTEAILRFPVEQKHPVMKELVRETTQFTVDNPGSNVTLVPNNEKDSEAAGYYEALVSFIGKAAHSSTPANGHNAIKDALRFFADIEALPAPVRGFIQFLAIVSAEDSGANLGIDCRHDFVGDTTCVISLLDIGAEGGQATLNIRPTMGITTAQVKEQLLAAAAKFSEVTGLDIETSGFHRMMEPIYMDPEQPAVAKFLDSLRNGYQAVTGEPGELQSIGGTTYAKALPNCCAFGPIKLGTDPELAHQCDERLSVDSIKRNALIYGLSLALLGE